MQLGLHDGPLDRLVADDGKSADDVGERRAIRRLRVPTRDDQLRDALEAHAARQLRPQTVDDILVAAGGFGRSQWRVILLASACFACAGSVIVLPALLLPRLRDLWNLEDIDVAVIVSSFFAAKFQGHLQEMLVAPVQNWVIILGHVIGGIVRGVAVGAVVTIVALFFTDLEVANPLVAFSMLILTATVFSLGGMINAIFARKFDDVSIIPSFVLGPLTYLGGVFYTISLLPDFWAKVSALNPILYMVNGFRYGMLGVSDVNIVTAYVMVLVFVVLAFATCFILIARGTGIRE